MRTALTKVLPLGARGVLRASARFGRRVAAAQKRSARDDIMVERTRRHADHHDEEGRRAADQPKKAKPAPSADGRDRPRGSSTYIPPPIRRPTQPAAARSLAPAAAGVYKPPPINSFSDRVTNCIHSVSAASGHRQQSRPTSRRLRPPVRELMAAWT